MRESRLYGSEGGGAYTLPTPIKHQLNSLRSPQDAKWRFQSAKPPSLACASKI